MPCTPTLEACAKAQRLGSCKPHQQSQTLSSELKGATEALQAQAGCGQGLLTASRAFKEGPPVRMEGLQSGAHGLGQSPHRRQGPALTPKHAFPGMLQPWAANCHRAQQRCSLYLYLPLHCDTEKHDEVHHQDRPEHGDIERLKEGTDHSHENAFRSCMP